MKEESETNSLLSNDEQVNSYRTIVMQNKLDIPNGKPLLRCCIVEFIGLLIFVFIGTLQAGSGGQTPVLVAASAHGITIALLIASMGHISGGHFNPAVTFGVFISGHLSVLKALSYAAAQLLGGFCGSLLAGIVVHDRMWDTIGGGATIPVDPLMSWTQGIIVECLLTFLLVNSVLLSAIDNDSNWLAPFAIGLTVFVDILAGGSISGASMNPARSLGPAIVGSFWPTTHGLSAWTLHSIYWIGPLAGAAIAALVYKSFLGQTERRWLLL